MPPGWLAVWPCRPRELAAGAC
uniref:Uncharacterized protein n=1 Tax=Arundo donax TaxID=35708 RepID=A0A0A9F6Z0_ARUDO